jgi:hypothetical protein
MTLAVTGVCALLATVLGADEGFVPLFNGRDLSGWVNVDVAPETFTVRDEMIISTGVPTGTMRTERMYENFIMELEWRHMKPQGNAGVFIWGDPLSAVGTPFSRGIEVQVLDGRNSETYTSHGDVFSIWSARMKPDRPHPTGAERCLPSERRCNPSPEWNHYRITCNDGVIKLAVNGKEVSGGTECRPRKGYICLESEGSECHFRNLKIKELPSTNASPEETAHVDRGFRTIYNGLDLRNWKATDKHREHWQSKDWRLVYDGKCDADDPHLWTEREYGDFELICDWRWTAKPTKKMRPMIRPDGAEGELVEVDDAGDSGIQLRGSKRNEVNIWCWPCGSGELWGYRTDASQPAAVRAGATPKAAADRPIGQWNRFFIRMRGDRVTVILNGEPVISAAQLPGIAARGPIGLQHHGDPLEFANIYVRELQANEPDDLPGPLSPLPRR